MEPGAAAGGAGGGPVALPAELAIRRGRRHQQVVVRVASQSQLCVVSELDRQAQLQQAKDRQKSNAGGNEETRRKHVKWKILWEEAMEELP